MLNSSKLEKFLFLSLSPEYLSTYWQAAVCGAQLSRQHIASGEKKKWDSFSMTRNDVFVNASFATSSELPQKWDEPRGHAARGP